MAVTSSGLWYPMMMLMVTTVEAGTRGGYGCNTCGGSGAYNTGRNIGAAINGAINNKIQGVAGFIDGLVSGPGQQGCGGCSSSCGSPGCGSHYVSQPNPCRSNSCYSGCGSHGCGSVSSVSSSCRSGTCGSSVSSSSSSQCRNYGSGSSCGGSGSGGTTVIIVSSQQQTSASSSSSSSSQFNPSAYPNCQCEYLFNSAGQGNCNEAGATSLTSDRWCYIAEDVNGQWVEAQWACPDAVKSDVHSGR